MITYIRSVTCDWCGERVTVENFESVRARREQMARIGWRTSREQNVRDKCPACVRAHEQQDRWTAIEKARQERIAKEAAE